VPSVSDLLWGIVYPALAAGCIWAFIGGAWFKQDARWVSSLAVATALMIAYVGLLQGPPLEPVGALEWLFWIAAAGALFSPLETLGPRAAVLTRSLFVGGLLVLTLHRQYLNHWSGPDRESVFPDVAICLAIGLCGWYAVERVAKRSPGSAAPLSLWAMAAALALCSLWSSTGVYAQLSGAVAAALGAAVVLAWIRPGTWFAGGGAGLAFALLFAIGIAVHYYAQLDTTDALLLASAPFAGLLADLPPLRKLTGVRSTALRLALVLIPLAIATQHCYADYAAQDADPYGSPSSY